MLTGRKAQIALREYLKNDTILREEIEAKTGMEALPDAEEPVDELAGYEQEDDSDSPSSAVIRDALGVDAPGADSVEDHLQKEPNSEEDIWAYREDGSRWDDGLELPESGESDRD